MNSLDKHYIALLEEILEYGTKKQTRNGEVLSLFGKQIRHRMNEGFPLLTTKKMFWKGIVTELMWFLQGRTDLKWLLEHNNTIWLGDAIKNYEKHNGEINWGPFVTKEEAFIDKIKTDDEFAKKWGELGPIYGKQWRSWNKVRFRDIQRVNQHPTQIMGIENPFEEEGKWVRGHEDQIANLIHDLKTNPDSRRLMVNSWNVGELDQMLLPPCHYSFQVYTRELSLDERLDWLNTIKDKDGTFIPKLPHKHLHSLFEKYNVPTRAISLMWNQRSVDTPLGLPFNIASYGLLLEIIAKMVNMVPDELIGNLGDCHIYTNQIEGIKEQIGREYTLEERLNMVSEEIQKEFSGGIVNLPNFPNTPVWSDGGKMSCLDDFGVPRRTREPYPLPKLNINTEFWPTESGECGVGPIDAQAVLRSFSDNNFCKCLMEEDIQLANYESHPAIRIPLSN